MGADREGVPIDALQGVALRERGARPVEHQRPFPQREDAGRVGQRFVQIVGDRQDRATNPAEDLEKVLEPFGQVDSSMSRKHRGTGLGLPLTRGLVELHGGSFKLESTPGAGTTVTLRFPARRLKR